MGLKLVQKDIKATFLHEELDKRIFMDQPKKFVFEGFENKVSRFKC